MPEILNPLIHIGYHKTGTNWLQIHVWPNNNLGLTKFPKKDVHDFFVHPRPFEWSAKLTREFFEPRVKANAERGLLSVISSERLSGNPHSGGYDSKEILERLFATFPNARVFMSLREQRSMVNSAYTQYVRSGGPGTVDQFLLPPEEGARRVPLFDFQHFAYHWLIQHYFARFGKDNVLALPYELFVKEPKQYVRRILEFAMVPIDEDRLDALPFTRRENAGLSGANIMLRRPLNYLFVHDRNNALAPFPMKNGSKFVRETCLVLEKAVPKKLSKSLESMRKKRVVELVGDRYKESNAITSQLIGIDLREYGYQM